MADSGYRKRRMFVVDRRLQYGIAFVILGLVGLASLGVWWDIRSYVEGLFARGVLPKGEGYEIFSDYSRIVVLKIVIGLCVVWPVALYYSNRVAGPIYRLRKSLSLFAAGNLSERIRLRRNDQFKYMADSYNEAAENLSQRVKEQRNRAAELSARLDKVAARVDKAVADELRTVSEKIIELASAFRI